MDKSITIINGPNLNLLGTRETSLYGTTTLADIEAAALATANKHGVSLTCHQSNHEGELITLIQKTGMQNDGKHAKAIIINGGGYSHTSIAMADALRTCQCVKIEVHLSNIDQREDYRHKSFLSQVVDGVIYGFGAMGYNLAVEAACAMMKNEVEA